MTILKILSMLVLSAGVAIAAGVRAAPSCALDARPTVISSAGDSHAAGGRLFQVWELDDFPALWKTSKPQSNGYDEFRRDLHRSGLPTDTRALLESGKKKGETAADMTNRQIAHEKAGDWIHPATCLEMLLVGMQNDRMPILTTSTEFAAMILRSSDGRRLRIYHYAKNQEGFGNVSELIEPVAKDHRDGWSVWASLHNHNFRRDKDVSSGVTAPSAADAQSQRSLAQELQLQEAWITNGVSTIRIPATEFDRFQAAE